MVQLLQQRNLVVDDGLVGRLESREGGELVSLNPVEHRITEPVEPENLAPENKKNKIKGVNNSNFINTKGMIYNESLNNTNN